MSKLVIHIISQSQIKPKPRTSTFTLVVSLGANVVDIGTPNLNHSLLFLKQQFIFTRAGSSYAQPEDAVCQCATGSCWLSVGRRSLGWPACELAGVYRGIMFGPRVSCCIHCCRFEAFLYLSLRHVFTCVCMCVCMRVFGFFSSAV